MKETERKDILRILKGTLRAIKKRDTAKLRELSNTIIHTASTLQDGYSITTAVLVYSFSKIFERNYYQYKGWSNFYNCTLKNLEKAITYLEKKDIINYEERIRNIFICIAKLDKKLRKYITDVLEKARINKASRIHEHGISVGRTAYLLGITEWELMDYIGKTGIPDVPLAKTIPIVERLKFARKLFEK